MRQLAVPRDFSIFKLSLMARLGREHEDGAQQQPPASHPLRTHEIIPRSQHGVTFDV
jgi:hypothetical protein